MGECYLNELVFLFQLVDTRHGLLLVLSEALPDGFYVIVDSLTRQMALSHATLHRFRTAGK